MRLIVLGLVAALLVGCASSIFEEVGGDPVGAAAEALNAPTVALGEALIQSQRQLEQIRYEVPRGQAMKAALGAYASQIAQLRAAAAQVSTAAQGLDRRDRTVQEAAAIVDELLRLASTVSAAAENEAAAYTRFADIDIAMDGVVAGWDQGGSQSELRDALRRLSANAADLEEAAGAVQPTPLACATSRDSRVRWAGLLKSRTDQLIALVGSRTGLEYDALRDRFRPQPYGVDRLTVDAADRQCWLANSPVASAEQQARDDIARLRNVLAGARPN
jgi:hypothetical protein